MMSQPDAAVWSQTVAYDCKKERKLNSCIIRMLKNCKGVWKDKQRRALPPPKTNRHLRTKPTTVQHAKVLFSFKRALARLSCKIGGPMARMALLLSEIGPKSSIVSEMLVYNPLCLRARARGEGGKGGCDRRGGRELRHSSTSLSNQDSQFPWILSSLFDGVGLKQYVLCFFFNG